MNLEPTFEKLEKKKKFKYWTKNKERTGGDDKRFIQINKTSRNAVIFNSNKSKKRFMAQKRAQK